MNANADGWCMNQRIESNRMRMRMNDRTNEYTQPTNQATNSFLFSFLPFSSFGVRPAWPGLVLHVIQARTSPPPPPSLPPLFFFFTFQRRRRGRKSNKFSPLLLTSRITRCHSIPFHPVSSHSVPFSTVYIVLYHIILYRTIESKHKKMSRTVSCRVVLRCAVLNIQHNTSQRKIEKKKKKEIEKREKKKKRCDVDEYTIKRTKRYENGDFGRKERGGEERRGEEGRGEER